MEMLGKSITFNFGQMLKIMGLILLNQGIFTHMQDKVFFLVDYYPTICRYEKEPRDIQANMNQARTKELKISTAYQG